MALPIILLRNCHVQQLELQLPLNFFNSAQALPVPE